MKYIRLFEERLKDFEILTNSDSQIIIDELKKEIEKEDYDLSYIRDLVYFGHFDVDVKWYAGFRNWTFIMRASELNKADIVRVLLEDGGADPNIKDSIGHIPIIDACLLGYLQVVVELLKSDKIKPNIKNHGGMTALHYASANNHFQIVIELLKHPKINKKIKDKKGQTAWDWADDEMRTRIPELKPELEVE